MKIPAIQRTSKADMSIWGGLQARFEYIDHAVIRINGASIALYIKRLRATFCMANPHAPAHSAMTMYSNASCASDRTFAR